MADVGLSMVWRRSLLRSVGSVVVIVAIGCCNPRLPPVVSTRELEKHDVLEQLRGVTPVLRRVDSLQDILDLPEATKILAEAGLLNTAKRLPRSQRTEILAWKVRCWFVGDQYIVGLFDGDTGRVLLMDDDPVFAIRVPIS
jgi:hypothetical protein